jgi:exonuclease VII large subunit
VSPLSILAHGYAIVTTVATGQVVRDAAVLGPGDSVTRFARGEGRLRGVAYPRGLTGAEVAPW